MQYTDFTSLYTYTDLGTIFCNQHIKHRQKMTGASKQNSFKLLHIYEGVSKSFGTESWRNTRLQKWTLVEKKHKGLWRQNSLGWLTK